MEILRKIEKFVGSVKFAVIIIMAFAIYLAYGTIVESFYNTDYANRLVYKSLPFMLLQLCMFLSIFIATTLRFPFKQRLLGFYVLHLGLLLIFVGSFVTYVVGVDGSMQLYPNTPNRTVILAKYQLQVTDLNKGRKFIMDLPYQPGIANINQDFEDFKFIDYFPFASLDRHWVKSGMKKSRSTHYMLRNENFSQDFLLSSHPDSEAKASINLGLLNIHYLPLALADCFEIKGDSSKELDPFILWDTRANKCIQASNLNSKFVKHDSGLTKLVSTLNGSTFYFIPQLSPLPVSAVGQKLQENSHMRVFSKKLFEDKPHLFAFGDKVVFFDKGEEKWQSASVSSKDPVELPWMGFELTLIKDSADTYPKKVPTYSPPTAKKERVQALSLIFEGKNYWLTSQKSLRLGAYEISLKPETITLPFQINLERFTMGKDPGTQTPASYESLVNVFDGTKSTNQKVFMNNPLDWDQFTFYQASYFALQSGFFGSILSVNYDPGRFLKYFGSLLLVLGSLWHFYLRKKWKW